MRTQRKWKLTKMRVLIFLPILSIALVFQLASQWSYASESTTSHVEEKKGAQAQAAAETAKAGLWKDLDEDQFADLYIKMMKNGTPDAMEIMSEDFDARYGTGDEGSLPKRWKDFLQAIMESKEAVSSRRVSFNFRDIFSRASHPEVKDGLCGKTGKQTIKDLIAIAEKAKRNPADAQRSEHIENLAYSVTGRYFEWCPDIDGLFDFFLNNPSPRVRSFIDQFKGWKIADFRKAFASRDPQVRVRSLWELGRQIDKEVLDQEEMMAILRSGVHDQNMEVRHAAINIIQLQISHRKIDHLTKGVAQDKKFEFMRDLYDYAHPIFRLRTLALALKNKDKKNQVWAAEELVGTHRERGFFELILGVLLKDHDSGENTQLIDFGAKAAVCAFVDSIISEGTRNKQINSLIRNFERANPRNGRARILKLLSAVARKMRESPDRYPCTVRQTTKKIELNEELEKLEARLASLKAPGSILPEPESQPCSVPDAKGILAPLEGKGQKCEPKGD